ncbi:MAG: alkaline phosphatase family protein, partial [Candidatus Omnitrophica bacterium]|nr:alkaline phosphatase family protein [Candidatus Omnitrophota bacterium]
MKRTEGVFKNKIIILGFDGLSPEIIEPMMQSGRLPHFARLKEQGTYRRLATTNPPQSPTAWSSLATGKNPGKHGIFEFIIRDPKTYALKLSLSGTKSSERRRLMRSKCFWNYASDKKIHSTIITHPVTFPPDKLYGRMLSGMGVPDAIGTFGTFTLYTSNSAGHQLGGSGKILHVTKSPLMTLRFIGPRIAKWGGAPKETTVPFKVVQQKGADSVVIEYQGKSFKLPQGEWSDWQEVTFRLGFLRTMKCIVKLYLVQVQPEFQLYISPINFDPRAPFFTISHPQDFSRALAENIGLFYTQGAPFESHSLSEGLLPESAFLEQVKDIFEGKKKMLDQELRKVDSGILFCYFEATDAIQHMFWRYRDPFSPLYDP